MNHWTPADWLGLVVGIVLLSFGAALVERWETRRWLRRQREK